MSKTPHNPLRVIALLTAIVAGCYANIAQAASAPISGFVNTACGIAVTNEQSPTFAVYGTGNDMQIVSDIEYACNINYQIDLTSANGDGTLHRSPGGEQSGTYYPLLPALDYGATNANNINTFSSRTITLNPSASVIDSSADGTMSYSVANNGASIDTGTGAFTMIFGVYLNQKSDAAAGDYNDSVTFSISPGTP